MWNARRFDRTQLVLASWLLALGACDSAQDERSAGRAPLGPFETLAAPVGPGSAQPNLTSAGERVYLSWIEPAGEEHALRFAVWEGGHWSAAHTIASGANFFVNWADFPSLVALGEERLAAHWLVRRGPRSYDYDVHLAISHNGGRRWSEAVVPHRDGTESEHGFVSLFPWPTGGLAAVWLDGRETVGPGGEGGGGDHASHGPITLRKTTLAPDGTLGPEVLLDERTCECCQTAAALTARGPVVVYRDRTDTEIRDIAIVRHVGATWTEPRIVHADGWEITGCPVNGPAVAAEGERVAVAWFTAAGETPRVQLAFSDDAGARFQTPVRVDDGDPVGRVAVLLLPDGAALVSWIERVGEEAEVRVRRVEPDGRIGRAMTVIATSAARASGFPRMVRMENQVVIAWTESDDPGSVRVARAYLPAD